ncbi:MAG: DUF3306 domain-containing protein, partial [Mesorhizobium sp.]
MLKRAALRRMWSLDPAIRDHIGPSEYAWDFNRPGSMAGFSPLKESSEPVVDFLSTLSGGNPADPAGAAMASEAPEKAPAPTVVLADEDANASPDASQAVTPDSSIEPATRPSPSADVAETAAGRDEAAGAAESSPINRQRRHGGAVPR